MIVCKYKFDSSIYNNLIPEFNSGYNGYSVNDTTDGNIVTRTIECDTLPTLMRFGQVWVSGEVQQDYTRCLLEVLDMNTSELTSCNSMFRYCINLTSINCNWNTSNVTDIRGMFHSCPNLTQLDVSNFDTSKVTDMSYMFYNCNKLAQLDVSNFNTSKVTNMNSMFYNCTKLTSLDVSNFNTSNVTNMSSMFHSCTKLTSLDVSNFNTSNVTNMSSMFYNCTKLTSLDVSNFNTSNVINMSAVFYGCDNLTQLDVSNFDTSKVTNMGSMFYGCTKLTSLDVSNWDTSKVTEMSAMFWKCAGLKLLILSNWNLSKVTRMYQIFSTNAGVVMSLETLDIANWEISDTTDTKDLFFLDNESLSLIKNIRCNNINVISNVVLPNIPTRSSDDKGQIITSATLSQDTVNALASKNWTVVSDSTLTKVAEYVYDSKIWRSMIPKFNDEFVKYFIDDVEDENGLVIRIISSMDELPTLMRFGRMWVDGEPSNDNRTDSLLEILDMNTSGLTSCNSMFRLNSNLTSIICKWNTSNVTNMYAMFNACTKLSSLDVSNFDTSNVTNMNFMFNSCYKLASLDLSNWNTNNVTDMKSMFSGCTSLTSLDVSNWSTVNATNMSGMFSNCFKLTTLDVSNFNTSNVTNMNGMFQGCSKLASLDVSNWDVRKLQNTSSMFSSCSNLTLIIGIDSWLTGDLRSINGMFASATKLSSLNLSNFDTSKVENMEGLFTSCHALASLDVSNWNTGKVTNMRSMFSSCNNLTSLDLSNWDTSKVTTMKSMFHTCSSLTSLDVSNFNTSKVTIMEGMFDNTSKLVNIGMLYCSPSTINTISSNLSNTLQKNIWIQNVKPSELPSYDYISYKKYKEEKELNLNSPLLEGDKIVKKDGKIYHYHKMGKVVFDGSEEWKDRSSKYISDTQTRFSTSFNAKPCSSADITLICDKYPALKATIDVSYKGANGIRIHIKGTTIYVTVPKTTLEEFKTHLQANPTTVVYELANPYYEEISNDTLYLSIDKLSDYKMVVNNSTIPTKNMVQNRTFSTITLKPNTVYAVKFDRIGTDELTIDLGGTITTCVGNKVEIITSNEITRDDIVFYGDDEISNVMVIESSFDENNMPKENFEGLKSSFEDRRLFNEEDSILYNTNNTYYNEKIIHSPSLDFLNPLTKYTVVIKDKTNKISNNKICNGDGSIIWAELTNKKIYTFTTPSTITLSTRIFLYSPAQVSFVPGDENNIQIYLFEGDWTHLTEEDFNNLGKYKVEYKTINCPIEFGKGGRIE